MNTKDALGKEIVMGELYGYSSNRNGITEVRIGKAVNFTPTGLLSLEVQSSSRGIYNKPLTEDLSLSNKKISVKPSAIFPIGFNKQHVIEKLKQYWENVHGEPAENSRMINWLEKNL